MRKKYCLIVLIISFFVTAALDNIKFSNTDVVAAGKTMYYSENIYQLIQESPVIIIGKVKSGNQFVKFDYGKGVLSQIEVEEVLKGNPYVPDKLIKLLQSSSLDDPAVKQGSEVLLFLEKSEDSINPDTYVCFGGYQGNYSIQYGKIKASAPLNGTFKASIEDKTDIISYIRQVIKEQ